MSKKDLIPFRFCKIKLRNTFWQKKMIVFFVAIHTIFTNFFNCLIEALITLKGRQTAVSKNPGHVAWTSRGHPMDLPWTPVDLSWTHVRLPWTCHEPPVNLPWTSCGPPVDLSWTFHGPSMDPMDLPRTSRGHSMDLP